ncbi:MAG: phenylacetate--CoA ligase family protein, partial [Candidatus Methylomirabilales bacterium]
MTDTPWPPTYDETYSPAPADRYWFREHETMDPEERAAVILGKLRAQLAYAWERAPFYRLKWRAAGLEPGDVKTLEDFRRIPVVTKEEIRADQEAHPPFGSYLCVPREEVVRVHGTSGTTGKPTAFAIGRDDWLRIRNAHARIMWSFGV